MQFLSPRRVILAQQPGSEVRRPMDAPCAILCRRASSPPSCILQSGKRWRSTRSTNTPRTSCSPCRITPCSPIAALTNLFRPPIYWPDFLVQSDIIGVGSPVDCAAFRVFHRRRAGAAIGGHAIAVRRHGRDRPIRQQVNDPGTGPGADRASWSRAAMPRRWPANSARWW